MLRVSLSVPLLHPHEWHMHMQDYARSLFLLACGPLIRAYMHIHVCITKLPMQEL